MQSFSFNDAVRFRLATQQDDTGAKIQVFLGVFIGVLLRWIVVDLIKNHVAMESCCGHCPYRCGSDRNDLRLFRLLGKSAGPVCWHAFPELAGLWRFHRRSRRSVDVLGEMT